MNKLGFGFLRFRKSGADYDWRAIRAMADRFLEKGGKYFDTCYTYLDGASEEAIRRCVVEGRDRRSVQICDKLPGYQCENDAALDKTFDEMRRRCGTDYFDVLMLHWLDAKHYAMARERGQFDYLLRQKKAGNALRIAFSYHDSAALLERILSAHPEVDVVQIQLNYMDWESAGIQSRLCYETCVRHGKKVIVMEPIKGGSLARLPEAAEKTLRALRPDRSAAAWALRFAMSRPEVETVLSGMTELAQVEENTGDAPPLTEEEERALFSVLPLVAGETAVPCTGCRYCEAHCPQRIPIPDCFALYNELRRTPQEGWKIRPSYAELTSGRGRASDCLACGSCEAHCPQKLPIPAHMRSVAQAFG